MLKIEIDDLKMLGLKYVASAIPGKSLKRKPTVTEEELKSKQKYVEIRYRDQGFSQDFETISHFCGLIMNKQEYNELNLIISDVALLVSNGD
jgi:hypothetical protein